MAHREIQLTTLIEFLLLSKRKRAIIPVGNLKIDSP